MAGKKPSLMRALGETLGHVVKAVKTPVEAPERTQVTRKVEQAETTDAEGRKVTVRRTTIEEIEITPRQQGDPES